MSSKNIERDITFGKTVKRKLIEHNITQRKLAEAIGVDPVTLNRYLNAERRTPYPTMKKIAEYFQVEPHELFGVDDPDVLLWHYSLLEGCQTDFDDGFKQALESGQSKKFIYPILRKYYTKKDILELAKSYDEAGNIEQEVWPEDEAQNQNEEATEETEIANGTEETERNTSKTATTQTCLPNMILTPPESLFAGETTDSKKELIEEYFSGVKNCIAAFRK